VQLKRKRQVLLVVEVAVAVPVGDSIPRHPRHQRIDPQRTKSGNQRLLRRSACAAGQPAVGFVVVDAADAADADGDVAFGEALGRSASGGSVAAVVVEGVESAAAVDAVVVDDDAAAAADDDDEEGHSEGRRRWDGHHRSASLSWH